VKSNNIKPKEKVPKKKRVIVSGSVGEISVSLGFSSFQTKVSELVVI